MLKEDAEEKYSESAGRAPHGDKDNGTYGERTSFGWWIMVSLRVSPRF